MRTGVRFRTQFMLTRYHLEDARRALEEVPKRIRGKVLRKGLRAWATRLKLSVKAATRRKDRRTRRDLAVKTKTYRRGKSIWVGVGVRTDGDRVGWKSHLHDGGYRAWQRGIKADGTPAKKPRLWNRNPNPRFVPFSYRRDWRSGLAKKNLGPVIYRTEYITRPAKAYSMKVSQFVREAVAEAIYEVARGGKTS